MNTKGEMWGKMNSCRMAVTPDSSPDRGMVTAVPSRKERAKVDAFLKRLTPEKRKSTEGDSSGTKSGKRSSSGS